MYYQNEMLANLKSKHIEEMARDAWKYTTPSTVGVFKNTVINQFKNKKSQTKPSSCLAC